MKTINLGEGKVLIGSGSKDGKLFVVLRPTRKKYKIGELVPGGLFPPKEDDTVIYIDTEASGMVLMKHIMGCILELERRVDGTIILNFAMSEGKKNARKTKQRTVQHTKQKEGEVRKPKSPM